MFTHVSLPTYYPAMLPLEVLEMLGMAGAEHSKDPRRCSRSSSRAEDAEEFERASEKAYLFYTKLTPVLECILHAKVP